MTRPLSVIFAEDDDEDWILIADVIDSCPLRDKLTLERVRDGQQLLDRLRDTDLPHPDVVLLDIQMPRKNGLETLLEMRAEEALRSIPVIILTTSEAESDVFRSYQSGANSYVVKPGSSVEALLHALKNYWVGVCRIPTPRPALTHQVKHEEP